MKLCIFSGTFNPIHNGHLYMAEYVLKNFDIKKILFIPAYIPPQKNSDPKMAYHRLKMTELAIENNNGFELSDIEFKMGGTSYTYLTVQELYKLYKPDGKINFIIGTDAFENLDSWYESEKLRQILDFIVFVRKDDFLEDKYEYMKSQGYNFRFAKMQYNDISSTEIRNKIKNNLPVKAFLPAKVEGYIRDNGLYKN